MMKIRDEQNDGTKQTDASAQGCCGPAPNIVRAADNTEQVKLLSALADTTRLQIVAMLAGLDEPLCVCEIQAHFQLGQPTISHHLKVLRDASLVKWEKRGLWVYYSLDRATLGAVVSYLSGMVALPALSSSPQPVTLSR